MVTADETAAASTTTSSTDMNGECLADEGCLANDEVNEEETVMTEDIHQEDEEDEEDDEEMMDLYQQVNFAIRANVQPMTVVMSPKHLNKGKGVWYIGEEPLEPDTTIGLYRMFMIQKDVFYDWVDNGKIDGEAWEDFWVHHTVEFVNGHTDNDDTDKYDVWMGLPVGDVDGDVDEPTWWSHGKLSTDQLERAIMALNQRVVVDWKRLARKQSDDVNDHDERPSFLFSNAHLLNEPSVDQEENIAHLTGTGCLAFQTEEDEDEPIQYCGTAFEAKTKTVVNPGDELVWCYGPTYMRYSYINSVSPSCLIEQ